MNNTKKLTVWQGLKQLMTMLFRLLLLKMKNIMAYVAHVGKKTVQKGLSLLPYIPYNVNNCTLKRFNEAKKNPKKIIRFGFRYSKTAQMEFNVLCNTFFKLCGNQSDKEIEEIRSLYIKQITIFQLRVAAISIVRDYGLTMEILTDLRLPILADNEKILKMIESQVRIHEKEITRINDKIKERDKSEVSVEKNGIQEQLISLSLSLETGYQISENITLAEYAAYIKLANEKHKIYEKYRK